MTARPIAGLRRLMLVTGATGFVGSRLATLAMSRGYAVRTLARSDWDGPPAVPVDQRYLGALPYQVPETALRDVDVVVHCAAQPDGPDRMVEGVNVEGTRYLLDLARRHGVETFIFLTSQSARRDAVSAYGRTKYAAEQLLRQEQVLRTVVLRPGLVTGPGSRGLFRRLTRVVHALPVIPLLGGGRAIVQPIHVDDLCAAIVRADELSAELDKQILCLGDPQGLSLGQLLRDIAIARLGRPKKTVSIPLAPVELVVRVAEALHVPSPITSNNLKSMKSVEKMDTAADLERLGLKLRPWSLGEEAPGTAAEATPSSKERSMRVVLVGAGRVGLVHAVTLQRLHGAVLAGIVDPSSKATALLRGMGIRAAVFGALDDALARVSPDAAVIATPPALHLRLARAALPHVRGVMIEKPLAVSREELGDCRRLAEEFPDRPIQVGYVMPRNPQVSALMDRLRAGHFGAVRGFVGVTLLSLVCDSVARRWEVDRRMSGGGALINAGGHVLSMIHAAFGEPSSVEAQTLKIFSDQVEDSAIVRLRYPGFEGRQYCSWSIEGYPRQENRLIVRTDEGVLLLTASIGAFVRDDGAVELAHQLDFDVGFNLAPDYAGAGFTRELGDLIETARTGQPAPIGLHEATRVEETIFAAYERARVVRQFDGIGGDLDAPAAVPRRLVTAGLRDAADTRRVLDLRDLPLDAARAALDRSEASRRWDEFQVTPPQAGGGRWRRGERLRVTVPDFLHQSRLLSNGRYHEVLGEMGPAGVARAVATALPLALVERGPTFWVAASGLLGSALQAVPRDFSGTLLLHGYLTDFALALRRLDMLDAMLATCRKARPRARVGIHSNMAAEAANALYLLQTSVDEVSILTSPGALGMAETIGVVRRAGRVAAIGVTAEVGLAPALVHRLAADAPHLWSFGAEAVLIGAAAEPRLFAERERALARQWMQAFPGVPVPGLVL